MVSSWFEQFVVRHQENILDSRDMPRELYLWPNRWSAHKLGCFHAGNCTSLGDLGMEKVGMSNLFSSWFCHSGSGGVMVMIQWWVFVVG